MKNGGPAFPQDGTYPGTGPSAGYVLPSAGMTLRDYFAAHAPASPQWWWDSYKTIWSDDLGMAAQHEAQWRFTYADAMLAERDKK